MDTLSLTLPYDESTPLDDEDEEENYVLATDNVNLSNKAKQTTISSGNKQYNLMNSLAVKCRVPFDQDSISSDRLDPEKNTEKQIETFFPSLSDNDSLKEDFKKVIGKILCDHIQELEWCSTDQFQFNHSNSKYTNLKSDIVNLGVIAKDENISSEYIEIMRWTHQYVPKNKILVEFGDELTVERISNCQEDMRNEREREGQLIDIVPTIADFHTFENFLEAIWILFFDPSSSKDVGIMYASKCFLNATNVPPRPMKDVDASYSFLHQYTSAL